MQALSVFCVYKRFFYLKYFIMTNLEIFKSDEFGIVRTAIVNNEPYFVARDIAERLGYTNPQKATRDHVDVDDRMLLQVSDLQGVNETLPPHRRSATIVKVLCAVGDFENGTFNLPHKPIRITNVQLTTSAPIAQNTCYRLAGFSAQKLNRSTNKKSFKK